MVRIPKSVLINKKPNVLHEDLTLTINDEKFTVGKSFAFVCIQSEKSNYWGIMLRNAKINSISPDGIVSISGTSDWNHMDVEVPYTRII